MFEAEMAFVALGVDRPVTRVKVAAAAANGQRAPTFEFNLKDTPCFVVYEGEGLFIPCDVAKLYKAEAPFAWQCYAGVPLRVPNTNKVIGHIALFAFRTIPDKDECMEVLAAAAAILEEHELTGIGASGASAGILRASADVDGATGLFTSRYFELRGKAMLENCKASGIGLGCVAVQIMPGTVGAAVENCARVALGNVMRAHIGPHLGVGVRFEDDEYGFIAPAIDAAQLNHLVATIKAAFKHVIGIHCSGDNREALPILVTGAAVLDDEDDNFGVIFRRSQAKLFQNRFDQPDN